MYKAILPRTNPQVYPRTLDSIVKGSCPVCGDRLHVITKHVGGHYGKQPFVACDSPDGGQAHFCTPISDELAEEYRLFMRPERFMEVA